MKYSPKGNWFICATNIKTGKKYFPFYDGFNSKKEAIEISVKLNNATAGFIHEVIYDENN